MKRKNSVKRKEELASELTRREFLKLGGSAALGLTFGAFAPSQTPAAGPISVSTVIPSQPRKIVISTWGGQTEAGLKEIVAPLLAKRYNATLDYDIGGVAARFSKLSAQAANPQTTVFLGNDALIYSGVQKGLFTRLNSANISNLKSLPDWTSPPHIQGYGACYSVIGCGLLYVNGKVQLPVTSWKDLWRDEFKKKLAFLAPGNGFMPAMLIIASELFGGNRDNIEPGLKALADLRPVAQVFTYTDYAAQLRSGDIIFAAEFDSNVPQMLKEGYDVTWVAPKEGAIGQLSSAALVRGGPHPDLGEALINILLDPEVQTRFSAATLTPPTHPKATLDSALAKQLMYGPRLQSIRWFDMKFIDSRRNVWIERINTEVVPKWRS